MLVLLIMSVIIGGIVAAVTDIGFLFWVVFCVIFICGLPGALISSFVYGAVDYAEDRADYRETMAQIAEDERLSLREEAEEQRVKKLSSALRKQRPSITDNRQIHIYGGTK